MTMQQREYTVFTGVKWHIFEGEEALENRVYTNSLQMCLPRLRLKLK